MSWRSRYFHLFGIDRVDRNQYFLEQFSNSADFVPADAIWVGYAEIGASCGDGRYTAWGSTGVRADVRSTVVGGLDEMGTNTIVCWLDSGSIDFSSEMWYKDHLCPFAAKFGLGFDVYAGAVLGFQRMRKLEAGPRTRHVAAWGSGGHSDDSPQRPQSSPAFDLPTTLCHLSQDEPRRSPSAGFAVRQRVQADAGRGNPAFRHDRGGGTYHLGARRRAFVVPSGRRASGALESGKLLIERPHCYCMCGLIVFKR